MESGHCSHRQWLHSYRHRQDLHTCRHRPQQDARSDMALLRIALYLWQLPQNLLGVLLIAILRPKFCMDFDGAKVYASTKTRSSVSLGQYIIIRAGSGVPNVLCHEWGHSRQSLYLGWLYLLVIGIPSLVWNIAYQEGWKMSYYDFYTEKWADKLGRVKR